MHREIEALNANNTWEFVDLPSNVVSIGSKWVYKIKRHVDDTIEKFKERLVAQGYNQTGSLDYLKHFHSWQTFEVNVCVMQNGKYHTQLYYQQ